MTGTEAGSSAVDARPKKKQAVSWRSACLKVACKEEILARKSRIPTTSTGVKHTDEALLAAPGGTARGGKPLRIHPDCPGRALGPSYSGCHGASARPDISGPGFLFLPPPQRFNGLLGGGR